MFEGLSIITRGELKKLGYKLYKEGIENGNYCCTFVNGEKAMLFNVMFNPNEVPNEWLITAYGNGTTGMVNLQSIEGLRVDELNRAHAADEEEVVFIAETVKSHNQSLSA